MRAGLESFCLKVGMQEEGINRQSYMKNGKIYDQWHLGITRNEIGKIYELD